MSSKWTLDIVAMQEDFFSDSALIGISSTLPSYQFCWLLNQNFDTDFRREHELDIIIKDKGKELFYPIYQHCLPLNGGRYLLYKMKCDKKSLMPEVKNLDYIWMMQGSCPDDKAAEISGYLKQIPEVQLAQVLVQPRLKNINNLLV